MRSTHSVVVDFFIFQFKMSSQCIFVCVVYMQCYACVCACTYMYLPRDLLRFCCCFRCCCYIRLFICLTWFSKYNAKICLFWRHTYTRTYGIHTPYHTTKILSNFQLLACMLVKNISCLFVNKYTLQIVLQRKQFHFCFCFDFYVCSYLLLLLLLLLFI